MGEGSNVTKGRACSQARYDWGQLGLTLLGGTGGLCRACTSGYPTSRARGR